ncbi:hypothetical protein ABFS82_03G049300 [Erythranthe guttata]|nr:PREDICTED: serpin-ZX-like [Erythranthe guttata]|eukprot:XP_012851772.1 PREDICTED: serpin-ZX-like [Erythranthe guttata]
MDLQRSIQNQSDFSLSLAKHVIAIHAKDKNLVFSPLSIHIALSMVAAGSDGPTRDELLGFLKSKSIEDLNFLSSEIVTGVFAKSNGGRRRPRLSLANGVWVEQSNRLKPAFREIMHNSYMAASNHVDFENKAEEVREEVNAWAEKETNGLIKDLLQPGSITPGTMLILANAVYFKGTWEEEFDESITRDLEFFLQSGSSIKAPFMCAGGSYQFIRAFDGFKVLRLSYVKAKDNRKFSMYFFLPDAKDGLPDLVEKIGSESRFIENHIPHNAVKAGKFRIPKFKIGFGFEASGLVNGLGVVHPFLGGDGVSEMVEEVLYVSRIFHKSFIEVNEQGTEAAAVTEVEMDMGCCMGEEEETVDFVADHPFVFVVREDVSGVVLFVGQLLNPSLDE